MEAFAAMIIPITSDAHPEHPIYIPPPMPEHPIYIPVEPPPDTGLKPEHPIYIPISPDLKPEHPIFIPVEPPPDSDLKPEHPIYYPVYPAHPIELPPGNEGVDVEKLKEFLEGNLPPFTPPNYPQPVKKK